MSTVDYFDMFNTKQGKYIEGTRLSHHRLLFHHLTLFQVIFMINDVLLQVLTMQDIQYYTLKLQLQKGALYRY